MWYFGSAFVTLIRIPLFIAMQIRIQDPGLNESCAKKVTDNIK